MDKFSFILDKLSAPESLMAAKWRLQFMDIAGSLATTVHPRGLLAYDFFTLPGEVIAIPLEPPMIFPPEMPVLLADATPVDIATFPHRIKQWNIVIEAGATLRGLGISSLSPGIYAQLLDPSTGMREVSVKDITRFVFKQYGKLTLNDIRVIQASLVKPLTNVDQCALELESMLYSIQLLRNSAMLYDEPTILTIISAKCASIKELLVFITEYEIAHMEWTTRTSRGLIDYIKLCIVERCHRSTQQAGYAQQAAALPSDIQDIVDKAINAYAASVANTTPKAAPCAKGPSEARVLKYCWYHGPNKSHEGTQCKHMADPKLGFTSQHIQAKSAITISGKVGHT